jgi:hypothetical protein
MTGPHPEADSNATRPISVAELLARNGTIGAPAVTRRHGRRRGDNDSVTVAELTGEIPIITDDHHEDRDPHAGRDPHEDVREKDDQSSNGGALVAESAARSARVAEDEAQQSKKAKKAYWSEPQPRWPKSPSLARGTGPERSEYPRPLPRTGTDDGGAGPRAAESQSGAEHMNPDPAENYADIPVDVMDSEVREAETDTEDSAYVRSYLQASDSTLFGGQTLADELARRRGEGRLRVADLAAESGVEHPVDETAAGTHRSASRFEAVWRGGLIVLQSILAVAFGAGLFVAFDQLWRWNAVVALVLSVLVILGLVVGVRVVRKTEDIASTLIAVAVGALITWGPLVLSLQAG